MLDVNRRNPPETRKALAAMVWVNVLIGAWVFMTAFFQADRSFYFWNNLVCGATAAALAFRTRPLAFRNSVIGGLAAVWLFFSAFVVDRPAGAGVYWNNLIMGSIIAAAALLALSQTRRPGRPRNPFAT